MSEQEQRKSERKTPAEVLEAKKAKLLKLQAELRAMERAQTAQERKDRDTALFTAGACLLAALEGSDDELRRMAWTVWQRVSVAHAPLITDHRRKCLDKTAFAGRRDS